MMIVQELIWGRKYNLSPAFSAFPPAFVSLAAGTVGYIFLSVLVDYYVATAVYLFSVAVILEKQDGQASVPDLARDDRHTGSALLAVLPAFGCQDAQPTLLALKEGNP